MKSPVGGISRGRKTVPEAVAMRGKSFRVTAKKLPRDFTISPDLRRTAGVLSSGVRQSLTGLVARVRRSVFLAREAGRRNRNGR